jgi:hypothetical protein
MDAFKSLLLKPWFVFAFSFILIGGTLILVSPNFFEGEIVYSQNGKKYVLQAPLSLAYFVGLGYQATCWRLAFFWAFRSFWPIARFWPRKTSKQ